MNSKKVNWMFLLTIGIKTTLMFGVISFMNAFIRDITSNLIISELLLLLPALVFVFVSKTKLKEVFVFKKIRPASVLMLILFVYLSLPLVTLTNAVSMLFSENAVAQISGDVLQMPFLLMLFLMGIYGPICEELVFRGIIHTTYRKSATAWSAMLTSALLFGLMHMNFNQAIYAFVIGIILALLKEATGSLLAPILYHVVFNSNSVVSMYALQKWFPQMSTQAMSTVMDQETLLPLISLYMVIAAVTTTIAGCVLLWIAEHENRKQCFKQIWSRRKEGKTSVWSIPLVLAVALCFAVMIRMLY